MSVLLSFTLLSSSVTMNAPIWFELGIANESREALAVDFGHNYKSSLAFSVQTPDGAAIQVPPLSSDGLGQIGRVQIEARGQYKRRYLLNEWYAFQTPGHYSIQPSLRTAILSGSREVVPSAVSSVMELTVTPRDSPRLAAICESLLRNVLEASDAAEIADGSLALSHVQDPVAVPYIRKGLEQGKLKWQYAIPGLARIANPEALDLLIEIMGRSHEAGGALARFHLQALAPQLEPELRKRILHGLQR